MKSLRNSALICCVFLLNSIILSAQSDFSGTWNLDHSKSDAAFRDYQVTIVVTQTPQTFSVVQILVMKSGEKTEMPPVTYNLDGKEVVKEEQGEISKLSAIFSPDKKTLTVKFVKTMDSNDFGSLTIYNLSDDGRIITIKSSDLTGESPMVQTYIKQ